MQFDHFEIVGIAIEAGLSIMDVYDSSVQIEIQSKEDDSPLTKADIAAHKTIIRGLSTIDPEVPVVSEEGRVGDPKKSELAWLVDPLDGTKEFIKRNGMFTVNIALMKRMGPQWKPIFGVVHAPVNRTTW
ncbi:MAG: inositol monophosphatase family protein, partial [Candidatus Thermoplasmatota archaeon]|nr:inositol monophosphatase family protein [Candidatus Thermoplasmatota archaeon]